MNFRNRWPHRQRAQTHPQPPPAACAPARRAGHPAGFSSHPPRGTTPPSTTPGRAAPHPTQSFRVVLGVGLPADVDQRESAPKPRAVWGQLLAPRERRSRAHGHDADTAAGAVLVDWADNVTTFTAERGASTDAGLGDRRGEIRAAAPLGCSHEPVEARCAAVVDHPGTRSAASGRLRGSRAVPESQQAPELRDRATALVAYPVTLSILDVQASPQNLQAVRGEPH